MSSKTKQQGIFYYLLLLTGFLLLLEVSFFIICNKAYLSDFTFMSSKIAIPAQIIPGILFFLGAQFAVHLAFCLLIWFTASFNTYLFKLKNDTEFTLALALWLMSVCGILAANQYYFPNSRFTELTELIFFSSTSAKMSAWALGGLFGLTFITATLGFMKWLTEKSIYYTLMMMLLVAAFAWVTHISKTNQPLKSYAFNSPNIILIGIDSLRPDFIGYFGADTSTPFLDSLLNQSTVFTEAITPLARTFPSWSGILLGKHPRESGIRFNLADTEHMNFSDSLPARLRQLGYETIYATDETRFSNIDQQFGFNTVVTPPIGLNDFLLGTFNDFPLSNLLINTTIGKWIFPYSYGNRPAYATYNPDSFIELIRDKLMQRQTKPVFMTVHFCLPHYPYLWQNLNGYAYNPYERYQKSIERVDQQLRSFFKLLHDAQLLDKAIVVVLSDHGEALELSGDRITQQENFLGHRINHKNDMPKFYPPSLDTEAVNQSAGHGTDVLGLPQYHTLLAFKLYGFGHQHTGDVDGVVSLTDISAAIISLQDQHTEKNIMATMVRGRTPQLPPRHLFIESDYTPQAIRTVYPETRKVLLEGIQLFQIHPKSTRLTVKPEMGNMIIQSKQYADIFDHWMLALYPQDSKTRMPILINLRTGEWTNDLQSSFARQSPAAKMLVELKKFYGSDIHHQS